MSPLVQVAHLQKYFEIRSGLWRTVSSYVKAVDDISFSIVAIAPGQGAASTRTIEADGRAVCPGFIDMHSHSDCSACPPD